MRQRTGMIGMCGGPATAAIGVSAASAHTSSGGRGGITLRTKLVSMSMRTRDLTECRSAYKTRLRNGNTTTTQQYGRATDRRQHG